MPNHHNRQFRTVQPVARAMAAPQRPLIGLRDTLDWVAEWPDTAHLMIAGTTAALSLAAAGTGGVPVQMAISAGLFVMGARLFSRFAR